MKISRPKNSTLHKILTLVWIALVIPSLTIWKDSLLWVIFMSLWANVASHAAGYDAARAEEESKS